MKKTTHFQLLLLCIFAMVCMPVFLSGQVLKTWNGSSSNNWNTPANWTPAGVPGEDDSVDIPADVLIWPTISTNDVKVYDISIKPGASLEVFNTGRLTINGGFSLNGIGITLGNEGTVINRGDIYITKPYANGILFADYGIYNFGSSSTFINYPSGRLYIDNETDGIVNKGMFTNEGLITIGGVANVQPNAIVNSGTFNNNNCPALIDIVSPSATISNSSTFDNSGTILSNSLNGGSIGNNTGVVQGSISVQSGNAPLPLDLFGELWIGCNSTNWNDPKNWVRRLVPTSSTDVIVLDATYDPVITSIATAKSVTVFFDALLTVQFNGSLDISGNAPQPGLGLTEASLINLGTVENNGRITISDDGFTGITNFSLINNNTCATLNCPIPIYNNGSFSTCTFSNAGLVKTANPMQVINGATFINDGILENFQGNLLPGALTNNELVVAPIYGCESTGIQPAIELVGTGFTISTTWYSNPNLTGPAAGTYNQATNTFTPSVGAGTHTLYMSIDGTSRCAKVVSILVNLTALDDASFSYALANYCTDVANPMPTVTGLAGGLFSSSPAGLSINAGSGQIDLSQSTSNTYTVTYTTTGTCPNSSNTTITVENCCAPPLASCKTTPINAILVGNSAFITAQDVDNGSTAECGLQSLEIDVNRFDCSQVGTPQTVTLTITDVNNDNHSCEATVNIIDDEVPTFTCPADLVINTNPGLCEGTVPDLLSDITDEVDNCGIPTLNQNTVVNTLFGGANGDQIIVTITANDGNGNQNATPCEVTLTLNDNENPVPTCLDPIVELDGSGQYTLTEADVFDGGFDNCGTVNFVSISSTILSCDDVNGPVPVTVTANDGNGNTGTCTATVTVNDTEAPTFSNCPGNISVSNDAGECGAAVSWTPPPFEDNCEAGATSSSTYDPGDFFEVGTTTVTYSGSDAADNDATDCSFTVTVNDTEAATFSNCPNTINVFNDEGDCGAIVSWTPPALNDNCPGATFDSSHDPNDFFSVGTTTVTYTGSDAADNDAIDCSFTVSVTDNEKPKISCPANISTGTDVGECGAEVTFTPAIANDNCAVEEIKARYRSVDESNSATSSWTSRVLDPSGFFPVGRYQIQWRAEDIYGNKRSCSHYLDVYDDEDPVAVCKDVTVDFNGEEDINLTVGQVWNESASSDNCGTLSYVSTSPGLSIDCDDLGNTIALTVTIEDEAGNKDQCTSYVDIIGLPCGWAEGPQDGSLNCGNDTRSDYDIDEESFSLTADGCWHNYLESDKAAFVYHELCGDGQLTARLADINTAGYAGLMARESLDPDARRAGVLKNYSTRRVRREYRAEYGGVVTQRPSNRSRVEWLRIVRQGNSIKSYTSTNGSSWRLLYKVTFPDLADCLYLGMTAYSLNGSAEVEAVFDNVSITSSGSLAGGVGAQTNAPGQLLAYDIAGNIGNGEVDIFPNPANNETQIVLNGFEDKPAQIIIRDQFGRLVRQIDVDSAMGLSQTIAVNDLAAGIYLVSIIQDQQMLVSQKLVVQQ